MVAVGANELALKIGGEWHRFPVLGSVQPALTSPFPGRVLIGDPGRNDELMASSYIVEDLGGGFGVEIMDPRTQFDRLWDSTLWTLQKNQLILAPRVQNVGRGTVAAGKEITAAVQFKGFLFLAWDTDVRRLESDDAISASKATLANTATDAISFGGQAFFAYDDNYVSSSDGSSWTAASPAEKTSFFVLWNSLLFKIHRDGSDFGSSTDGASWTARADIPGLEPGEVSGLEVFFTPDSNLNIHAVTKRGLWVYDATSDAWRQTLFQHARHPKGGLGHAFHRDSLYSSAGATVYQFTGNTVTNVGLDRDHGLPQTLRGNVVRLLSSQNWLTALMDGSQPITGAGRLIYPSFYGGTEVFPTSVGYSAIYLFNDRGWHHLWRSGAAARPSKWMAVADVNADYRLYWGSNGDLLFTRLSPNLHNPLQSSDLQKWGFSPSGYLETPWFNGTIDEMDKLGIRLKYRTLRTTASETVSVKVGYDLSPEWIPLDTATEPGRRTVDLAGPEGRPWEYLRLRFELQRGEDVSRTPVLVYAGLKFVKTPNAVWGIAATIDVSGTRDHLQPRESIALLEELARTKTLVPISWRDESGETQVKHMRLTRLVGQELAGPDGRGRWQIGLSEV